MKKGREGREGKRVPSVGDGDDAAFVEGDLLEGGLGHVEVLERGVAPAAVGGGERDVGRAEVGGRHDDGGAAGDTPLRVVGALHLEARATRQAPVEQRRAQRRR